MAVKIVSFQRFGASVIVAYKDAAGKVKSARFPAVLSDADIVSRLNGNPAPVAPETTKKEEPKQEAKPPQPEPPKKVTAQMDEQHILRERYLAELKAAGVETAGLRAFSRIEALWKEKCNRKGGK